jgi:hypothetical protein
LTRGPQKLRGQSPEELSSCEGQGHIVKPNEGKTVGR